MTRFSVVKEKVLFLAIRFLKNYILSLTDRIKSKKELCDSYQVNYSIVTLSLDQLRTTCSFREPGNKTNCGCSTISSRESFMFSLFRLSSSAFCESIATIVQKFQTSLHAIVCFAGAATYIEINTWQGMKLTFFSDSRLAPKFFKVVANSKKVGRHFQRQTKSFFTLSAF